MIERRTDFNEMLAPKLAGLQTVAIGMVVIGGVLAAFGAMKDGMGVFFQSWLFAYMFWVGVTVGSLGFLMLHHTVSGGWGFVIRRMLEAATKLLPLMAILFLPVLILGMHSLYEWTHADVVARDPILQVKSRYLNLPFFIGRFVFYFAVWYLFAHFFNKWGDTQDERSDRQITHKLNLLGGGGMLVYVLTVTFAVVDWVMSLTPHWYSSIIGLLFTASQGLSTLALMLYLLSYLFPNDVLLRHVPTRYFRDLGNFLLAFVLLWAYMSFSQYLIIWSGNTAENAPWYVNRGHGGWGLISLLLIPLHFGLPFMILLWFSGLKRTPSLLGKLAFFIVLMRFMDLFWWVAPNFRSSLWVSPSDFGAPLLIGGIWLYAWSMMLKQKPFVPVHDPRLEGEWPLQEAVTHG